MPWSNLAFLFLFQAKRKEVPEKEIRLNNAVECVGQLEDQLDESTVEKAQGNVNDMKERWGVVTQRLDDFCNRDIPVGVFKIIMNEGIPNCKPTW